MSGAQKKASKSNLLLAPIFWRGISILTITTIIVKSLTQLKIVLNARANAPRYAHAKTNLLKRNITTTPTKKITVIEGNVYPHIYFSNSTVKEANNNVM